MAGSLPDGLTFRDNGNGTGSFVNDGTATAGTYAMQLVASTPGQPDVTQDATMVLTSAPVIFPPWEVTVQAGSTFVVSSYGVPTASLTADPVAGFTLTDNGDGTGTVAVSDQTPAGVYRVGVTADNGYGTDYRSITVHVARPDSAPSFTSNGTASLASTGDSFAVTTNGSPAATLTTGALPLGVTFTDNGDGTGVLTAGIGAIPGSYEVDLTADNGIGSPAGQALMLTITEPSAITTGPVYLVTSSYGSDVGATGTPSPALHVEAPLPSGVTFVDHGDGTGTFTDDGSAVVGNYPITVVADNGVGVPDTQDATLVVAAPAVFTSADTAALRDTGDSFLVTTTGTPTPTLTTGPLPFGVTSSDNGDGTGTLSTGIGAVPGTYTVDVYADNGVAAQPTSQVLTLIVTDEVAITSDPTYSLDAVESTTALVTTTGYPTATLAVTGTLPSGVTFVDNGDGTGTFADDGSAVSGSYPVVISANNNVAGPTSQLATVVVTGPPVFTSATSADVAQIGGTFLVTTAGAPQADLSLGPLPLGVTFTDNHDGTGTLAAGIGAVPGSYDVSLYADNGVATTTSHLALTITSPLAITSDMTYTLRGAGSTAVVVTTGFPTPALTITGSLPNGVTFTDNGDGTGTFANDGSAVSGTSVVVITADNGVDTTGQLAAVVVPAPAAFISATSTTFGWRGGSFTVKTAGASGAALTAVGVPAGITFTDAGDGTGTLHTTGAFTGGVSAITFSATLDGSVVATQDFTLTLDAQAQISSAGTAAFTTGVAGSFDVTTSGFPAPSLSVSGALPSGVTFVDNGDGSGTLAGTPAAGTAGTYPLVVLAVNGIAPDASQPLTLSVAGPVGVAPTITSAATTSLSSITGGNFTVTTTGSPSASLGATNLPLGVSFADNHDGTGTLTAGLGVAPGTYSIGLSADNGIAPNATQTLTLVITSPPAFTNAEGVTFDENVGGNYNIVTTGSPTASIAETGALPSGLTFSDNGDGTGSVSGTPDAGTAGTYPITFTASNGISPDAVQHFSLVVDSASVITSVDHATIDTSTGGSVLVTATGSPAPQLGAVTTPTGITFTDNGDGTGTLVVAPGAMPSSYIVGIDAVNVAGVATQQFSLTVTGAPAWQRADSTTCTAGAACSFTANAGGWPTPTLSGSGTLPPGMRFVVRGVQLHIIGTLPAGLSGVYPLVLTATNSLGVTPQDFTLVVGDPPAFTSSDHTTLSSAGSTFAVTAADGLPATFSILSGAVAGVSLTAGGTLSVAPGTSDGSYPMVLQAANAAGTTTQDFTLSVATPPSFTSPDHGTVHQGSLGTVVVTASGSPTPSLSADSSTLPGGVSFVDNGDGTGSIHSDLSVRVGSYPITLTATNGAGADATQDFTLVVGVAPSITSPDNVTFTEGTAGMFSVHTTGFPLAGVLESGALPSGVTFTDNGDGSGTLSGTPVGGTSGTYPLAFTATNGLGPDAVQQFTLTVNGPPVITSGGQTEFWVGESDSFGFTATGTPGVTDWSYSGTLPAGVYFNPMSGTLAGTAQHGSGGSYAIQVTANNGVENGTTEAFTLFVNELPYFTSGSSATFTMGTPGSFSFTTGGYPAANDYTETGVLPAGVTLSPNGTLSGTPALGTAGTWPIDVTAGYQPRCAARPQCAVRPLNGGGTQHFVLTVAPGAWVIHASTGGAAVAANPDGSGYWISSAGGDVTSHGSAISYGSMAGKPLNALIVGMAATSSGQGYWLAAADGGVFSFGDAPFLGGMGGRHLNAPIVGMAATSSGHGYWLVASDGGVFNFGDAGFHGSMGGSVLNAPIVGIASTPSGHGYWMVASDGGVFNFGDAGFYGSTGAIHLNKPMIGLAAGPGGQGYWMVASDGGVFAFGSAAFHGSMPGSSGGEGVIGIIAKMENGLSGYELITSDGVPHGFGA